MSARRNDREEADRLDRVKLNGTIEPGDHRVTRLVSEFGADTVFGYLEAAVDVESHWAFSIGQRLAHLDPSRVLEQAADHDIRYLDPTRVLEQAADHDIRYLDPWFLWDATNFTSACLRSLSRGCGGSAPRPSQPPTPSIVFGV